MDHLTVDWTSNVGVLLTLTVGVGLFLIYFVLVLRRYVRIMVNLVDDQSLLPENGNGEPTPLDGDEVWFRALDGHRLSGTLLSAREGTHGGASDGATRGGRGVVIFAHEFGSDRSSCFRYCLPLLDAGFDVFAFDFRGHGGSPGEPGYRPRQWPSDRETADMRGAIAFVESRLRESGRPLSIGVFGLSRGASAAILAAVGNDSVRAIVADGAYSSDLAMEYFIRRFATIYAKIRVIAENHPPIFRRFLRWLLFRECTRRFGCRFPSVRKALLRMGGKPILMIHGEKDSYIPFTHCQALYNLAAGPKSLWIVPDARHNQCVMIESQVYARRVVGFFEEHLLGFPSAARTTRRRTAAQPETSLPSAVSPEYAGVLVGATMGLAPPALSVLKS